MRIVQTPDNPDRVSGKFVDLLPCPGLPAAVFQFRSSQTLLSKRVFHNNEWLHLAGGALRGLLGRFSGLTSTSPVWMLTFPAKRNNTEQRNCLYEAEAMLMRTWICDGIGRSK